MKTLALTLAVAALASGCVMSERVGDAAGQDYSISCPSQEMHYCFSKAAELCPKGYTVVDMRRVGPQPAGEVSLPPLLLPPGQVVIRDRIVVRCET